MVAILTLTLKFPPDYVLDKMEMYEVRNAFKYQYYSHKNEWEQARLISYITAQVNSTKKLSITDIVTFPWEKDSDNLSIEEKNEITDADIKRLKEKAQQFLNHNKLNN